MAKDFTTSFTVDQSPAELFEAINNVRGWWQGEVTGSTGAIGDEFTYQMAEFHFTRQRVVEMVPGKRVVWLVTESRINFVEDKKEWLNTKIIFDISTVNGKTNLNFTHEGLVPTIECYEGCSVAWDNLIRKSLLSLVTTGAGVDVF